MYDHKIPDTLNPTGDICVSLFIPDDDEYLAIFLAVLRQLEDIEIYYEDEDGSDTSAQTVAGNFRDRTITPLIDALAAGEACVTSTMKATVYEIALGATRTTTSASFVDVTDTVIAHIFEHPNALIAYRSIQTTNSGGNTNTFQVAMPDGTAVTQPQQIAVGTVIREIDVTAKFDSYSLGAAHNISLQFKRTAGTASVFSGNKMMLEILEWD